jgi:hypothetical protein
MKIALAGLRCSLPPLRHSIAVIAVFYGQVRPEGPFNNEFLARRLASAPDLQNFIPKNLRISLTIYRP